MTQNAKTQKPKSFEDVIEEKIVQKGLTAPRVTKAQIDELFEKIEYVFGIVKENRIMCSAYLDGFAVADGFGQCVDPKNFDEEIGKTIAHKECVTKAYDKLWELEGYRLSRSLVEAAAEQS